MKNKLTSLTGFGEGDPKPEKNGAYKIERGVLKTRLNQVGKPHKTSKGYLEAMRSPAKSKALSKKTETRKGYDKYVSVAKKEGRPHFDVRGDYHPGK